MTAFWFEDVTCPTLQMFETALRLNLDRPRARVLKRFHVKEAQTDLVH